MIKRMKIITWTVLFFVPFAALGQMSSEYEEEENKVINQFFRKFIGGDSLNATSNQDSLKFIYFNTRLGCNLDKSSFKGNYKPNRLLRELENNQLGVREIDSTKIERLNNVKIIFEDKVDYSFENYESDNVIGTFDISRVSFNKSFTIGYFYVSVYCGGECGWGNLIKIKRKKENWVIVDYLVSWVS